jgi:RNA polymerase sigma-70 factor, ECF subfamily
VAPDEVTEARRRGGIQVLRPADEVQDAELVERARAGDRWAVEALYRRYVRLVAGVARRLLRDASDTEDVVQETFLHAFDKLAQLEEPAAVRGWLARIAVSRAHRRFRWRRVTQIFGRREQAETLADQAHPGATPEQRMELEWLDRALSDLPLKLRTPWLLRHIEGHSMEETAVACGCSLATVKRRIAAAEERVQRHIEEGRDG